MGANGSLEVPPLSLPSKLIPETIWTRRMAAGTSSDEGFNFVLVELTGFRCLTRRIGASIFLWIEEIWWVGWHAHGSLEQSM